MSACYRRKMFIVEIRFTYSIIVKRIVLMAIRKVTPKIILRSSQKMPYKMYQKYESIIFQNLM